MAKTDDFSPEFEAAWGNYPRRMGNNSKRGAWTQWQKRISEGVDPGFMLKQTVLYKKHCEREDKIGTAFVMMAQTFYGPSRPFESDYGPDESGPSWNRPWGRERPPTDPGTTGRWEIKTKKR
jgi:hypothetical protein